MVDLLEALLPVFVASVATLAALIGLSRLFAGGLPLLLAAAIAAYGAFAAALAYLPSGRRLLQRTWRLRAMLKSEKPPIEALVE